MNYRHIYHAGNFADVFKHIVLIALIQSFLKKETPFCYLETHAGVGHYDLREKKAQRNKEFELGVMKVSQASNAPSLVKDYLACVKAINPSSQFTTYPGSPYFAHHFARPSDRLVLCELQAEEQVTLKSFFSKERNIAVHQQDGYQGLKAFLPPKEKRGLVLIDPPYENPDEFNHVLTSLPEALTRWNNGIFALWYPIKNYQAAERFTKTLTHKLSNPWLLLELSIYPENINTQLNGSGMLIINPPWKLKEEMQSILPWLWDTLSINGQGVYRVRDK